MDELCPRKIYPTVHDKEREKRKEKKRVGKEANFIFVDNPSFDFPNFISSLWLFVLCLFLFNTVG